MVWRGLGRPLCTRNQLAHANRFQNSTQPHTDDEADTTRRGLGAVDSDFESAVVRGNGTVSSKDMPFVNRWHELFELFSLNAMNMFMLKDANGDLDDFRPYRMVFCVQYYGSGKTTLGKQFFEQLKKPEVQTFFDDKLKEHKYANLRGEWEALKDSLGDAQHLFLDGRAYTNIVQLLSSKILDVGYDDARDVEGVVAVSLVDYAAKQNGPLLVHFDEVGSHPGHDIQSLQRLAAEAWAKLCTMADNGKPVPTIYFLATGKSTEPFEVIGQGKTTSPCGSHFLVLDMLKPEHVGEVRRWLTGDDLVSRVPDERQLKLNLRDDKEVVDYLDKALTEATGGAPRLLLYTLRALAYLQCPLDSDDAIDAALDEVFTNISDIGEVSHDLLPPGDGDIASVHFSYLLTLSLAGPLKRTVLTEYAFQVHDADVKVARMMRFQPFFLSRAGTNDERISLELPGFHRRQAAKKYSSKGVPMFLLALPHAGLELSDRLRVFEVLVPHAIAGRAGLARLIGQDAKQTWAEALPKLFGKSKIAAGLAFDLGDNPFESRTVKVDKKWTKSTVPPNYIANGVVYPPQKSTSEDAFHFQYVADGNSAGVVGWQMKFFSAEPFQMKHLKKEVPKLMASISEVCVIACTNYGQELLNVLNGADDKVVVLTAWSSDTAAVYQMATTKVLLWRADAEDSWCVFPSKATDPKLKPKGKPVTVRPGLEVVLPHPDVVAELVGSDLITALQRPSEVSAGLVVRRLDDILGMKRDAAAVAAAEPMALAGPAPSESVVISVRLKDKTVEIQFSQQDDPESIERAIRRCFRLHKDTEFELINSAGRHVVVTANIPDGNYTVELIDSTQ